MTAELRKYFGALVQVIQRSRDHQTGAFVTKMAVASLLIVAALLKISQNIDSTTAIGVSDRWATISSLQFGLPILESLVAFWLLSGIWESLAWKTSLILFSIFVVVSFIKWVNNSTSCGCFGAVHASPRGMFTVDLMACASLWVFRPNILKPGVVIQLRLGALRHLGALLAFVFYCVALFMIWRNAAGYHNSPQSVDQFSVLEPNNWINKPFPLELRNAEGIVLDHGHWLVLLYRSDCDLCHRAITLLTQRVNESEIKGERLHLALVEVPTEVNKPHAITDHHVSLDYRLADVHEWYGTTPIVVDIVEGVVKKTLQGEPVLTEVW